MKYCILFRLPNGGVWPIHASLASDCLATYPDAATADAAARAHPILRTLPYQVVPLDIV